MLERPFHRNENEIMCKSETSSIKPVTPSPSGKSELVASVRHTWRLLSVLALCMAGELALRFLNHSGGTSSAVRHPMSVIYLSIMVSEWAFVFGIRGAIRKHGKNLRDLVGGRWTSWKAVASDFFLALVLLLGLMCLVAVAAGLTSGFGQSRGHAVNPMLPQGPLELVLWAGLSLTAGFCEELAFRGYFQRQFQAMTGSIAVGCVLQAALFGLLHLYQGVLSAIVITGFGILFGLMAQWRRSLRPGMLAHACCDLAAVFLLR